MKLSGKLDSLLNQAHRNGDETAVRYLQQLRDPTVKSDDDLDTAIYRGTTLLCELAAIKAVLGNADAAHLNLLRGTIAMPSPAQLRHLIGGEATAVSKDGRSTSAEEWMQWCIQAEIERDAAQKQVAEICAPLHRFVQTCGKFDGTDAGIKVETTAVKYAEEFKVERDAARDELTKLQRVVALASHAEALRP